MAWGVNATDADKGLRTWWSCRKAADQLEVKGLKQLLSPRHGVGREWECKA